MFYPEHPKILFTRIKPSVAMAIWSPVFVHFHVNQFFINSPSGRITVRIDFRRKRKWQIYPRVECSRCV